MNETTNLHETLRDLVGAFVGHPQAIELGQHAANNSCLWLLKGHGDDEPKLIGQQGSHVKALRFLVGEFGRARGEEHTLRLVTERAPLKRARSNPRAALTFNPAAHVNLLTRIVGELSFDAYGVQADPAPGDLIAFTLRIRVVTETDYKTLTAMHETPGGTMNIVGALGTLFRAVGCEHGIRYEVKVETTSCEISPSR